MKTIVDIRGIGMVKGKNNLPSTLSKHKPCNHCYNYGMQGHYSIECQTPKQIDKQRHAATIVAK